MVTRAGGEALAELETAAPKLKPPAKKKVELSAPVSSVKPPVLPEGIDADELKKFQGKWKVVRIVAQGKTLPTGDSPELHIAGTAFAFVAAKKKDDLATLAKLDPTAAPKQIDLKAAGEAASLGIYEFVGATKLRMKFDDPGKPRRTAFDGDDKASKLIELEKLD